MKCCEWGVSIGLYMNAIIIRVAVTHLRTNKERYALFRNGVVLYEQWATPTERARATETLGGSACLQTRGRHLL